MIFRNTINAVGYFKFYVCPIAFQINWWNKNFLWLFTIQTEFLKRVLFVMYFCSQFWLALKLFYVGWGRWCLDLVGFSLLDVFTYTLFRPETLPPCPWCPWNSPIEIYNPFNKYKMPWCYCDFKNDAYRPDRPQVNNLIILLHWLTARLISCDIIKWPVKVSAHYLVSGQWWKTAFNFDQSVRY